MARNCKNCKFHKTEWEWDETGTDEVKVDICQKGYEVSCEYDFRCPYFKGYKAKSYAEKFTECDRCEYVKECENSGNVVNTTNHMDKSRHFAKGLNAYCRKESGALEDKKLSEIINISEKLNCLDVENYKEFFRKAIKRFGDITYKEFIKDKIFEMYED